MQAQVIKKFGDSKVFELVELPKPEIKTGHVLIKVFATSVNQIDIKIRSGVVSEIAPDFPAVLHGDVAGVIVDLSPEITDFKLGDEVYGCVGGLKGCGGALAEFVLADVKLIAKKPHSLSMLEAAALPLVGITAWEALFEKTKLTKGKTVLIHGALGGVGHIAVQLAKYAGATVYATVLNLEDFSLAKSLGADVVINAKEESVEDYVYRLTKGEGFDLVFDTVGGANLDKSLMAAAIGGTVVTTAARSSHDLTPMHNKALNLSVIFMLLPLLKNYQRENHGKILKEIATIVDQGQLRPLIDSNQFSLATVGEAHALLESGKARGKVVVAIP